MNIVLIICLCGIIPVGIFWLVVNYRTHRIKTKVSFKNSIDKSALVIIPLKNNGKKLNFVVDSGSTCNVLNLKALDGLDIEHLNFDVSKIESISVSGRMDTQKVISMKLENEQEVFFETFFVMDITDSLEWSKEEYGEEVHGILGVDFLTHYGKVLDFDNCIIYSR